MRVLVTRPEPEASAMAAQIEALGAETLVEPLMRIVPCPPSDLGLDGVDALIVTSRNGLKAIAEHPALPQLRARPLFAVGPGTAAAARGLGFATVIAGPATALDLVATIAAEALPPTALMLHLRGEQVAYDVKAALAARGRPVREAVVYRSEAATALSADTVQALAAGAIDTVLLMSPLTARTFVGLVRAAGLGDAARGLRYACLSRGVADALAELEPASVLIAARPTAEVVLALIGEMAAQSTAKSRGPKKDSP